MARISSISSAVFDASLFVRLRMFFLSPPMSGNTAYSFGISVKGYGIKIKFKVFSSQNLDDWEEGKIKYLSKHGREEQF